MVKWLKKRIVRAAMASLDLQDFEDCLPMIRPGRGGYTTLSRYEDFRAVFFGHSTPQQGLRVYGQIIDYCERNVPAERDVHDHAFLAYAAGQRNVGKTVALWAGYEPPVEQIEGERNG